jgi:hypothetical protein
MIFGWIASSCLIRFRVSVLGWATLDDISNVDFFSCEVNRVDYLSKQLSGATYKGFSLNVLITSRPLTYKYQLSFRVPAAKDDVSAIAMELTPFAITKFLFDLLKELDFSWSRLI